MIAAYIIIFLENFSPYIIEKYPLIINGTFRYKYYLT